MFRFKTFARNVTDIAGCFCTVVLELSLFASPVRAPRMAPPERVLNLLRDIEYGLMDAQPPPPQLKGGLGGGWRLHQGTRRATPAQAEVVLGRGAPEKRVPLYAGARPASPRTTLEAVVDQRQSRRGPPGAPPAERRPENGMLMPLDLVLPPPAPPARSVASGGGPLGSFLDRRPTSFLDEIDEAHSSLADASPRGLTTTFMNRMGGAGSRIDYASLRAELVQQQQQQQLYPQPSSLRGHHAAAQQQQQQQQQQRGGQVQRHDVISPRYVPPRWF